MTPPDTAFHDTPPFRVAGWQIRPRLLEAEPLDGPPETLEPKLMGVLCRLAESDGDAVSRRDLFGVVWAGTVVGDDVLTRAVSELRKMFSDDARAPRIIGTVPRVGYRLLAPVTWESAGEPEARAPEPVLASPDAPPVHAGPFRRTAIAVALLGLAAAAVAVWQSRGPAANDTLASRPLTTMPGYEVTPALSPDGSTVVYAGGPDRPNGLYVMPADGGDPIRLVQRTDLVLGPRWSPDGTRIAYVDVENDVCRVMMIAATGGPETAVAPCPGERMETLDWWPDGRSLVLAGNKEAEPEMTRLDVASGRVTPLRYTCPPGAVDTRPRVSPDGTRVLFRRTVSDDVQTISVLDVASGVVTPLVTADRMMPGHDWLPDGGVVYALALAAGGHLWRLASADGTARPQPLPVEQPGIFPDIAAGGLVFERWRVDIGLWNTDFALPDTLVAWAPSTAYDAYPDISPDGSRVAFLSERSGSLQVWVASRSGTRAQAVTDMDGISYSTPRWSPDGERLVFAAVAGVPPGGAVGGSVAADADVFVIDRIGRPPRRIEQPGSSESHPTWSADGRTLTVTSDRSGEVEIWRVPVNGGAGVQVTRTGGLVARPSPDGRTLYTMRPDGAGLWARTGDRGEDALLVPGFLTRHLNNWAPVAGGVAYLARDDRSDRVLRSTAAPGDLVRFPRGGGAVYTLDVAGDGASAIVSRIASREVDLAITDLPAR